MLTEGVWVICKWEDGLWVFYGWEDGMVLRGRFLRLEALEGLYGVTG